jgi:hypothetical protein
MADTIRRIDYFYVRVKDQPGEGFRALSKLKEAGVNLLNLTAFPAEGGMTQIDFVPENSEAFLAAARTAGLQISAKKQCFLIQGKDRVGAIADIFKKLADAKINGHAANASCAPGGYGMVLWVKPEQMGAAAKALGL